tara:strand:- start:419 stop:1309 length:891 start_codon:yes stop_codon:yes gene_type:complete
MVYNLDFINSIKEEVLSNNKLPDDVIVLIRTISDKVLSPNYSKTPVFTKKRYNNNSLVNYNKFVQHSSTKIIQDKNVINNIKCLLNKLSNKTIGEISLKIAKDIDTSVQEDKLKIIDLIFSIKTNSNLFIKLYSNLIKSITLKNPLVRPIIFQVVNKIVSSIIDELKSVDTYDELCKKNEILENKTSQYILIVFLITNGTVDKTFGFSLLKNLEKIVLKNVEVTDYKDLNEYYIKNICKILNILNENSDYEDDIEPHNKFLLDVLSMSSMKSINKGLSNKTKFNIMDYCDENGLEY